MGLTWDLQRIYNGTTSEGVESSRRISWKPVLIFWDGFTFFLKDNGHIVIATENNEIIVTRAFSAFFKHTE